MQYAMRRCEDLLKRTDDHLHLALDFEKPKPTSSTTFATLSC
jgi:hypothetical protein